jgi:3-oxoacyl-[acyl-carrier-protein] synthase-1
MRDVFVAADNIFSPLGTTTAENFSQLKKGISGVARHDRPEMSDQLFYASLFDPAALTDDRYTKFEQLLLASVGNALQAGNDIDPADPRTILIVSTTKGNISLLENAAPGETHELSRRIALPTSARLIADYFHFVHAPIIVSNACISGLLALITAMRLIRSGRYDNAVIAGADVISRFVLSGFNSFQAISPGPCRPFDRSRDGINLGEGAGTVILSTQEQYRGRIRLGGGAVGNDANHISGPSRTGLELAQVIDKSLKGDYPRGLAVSSRQ